MNCQADWSLIDTFINHVAWFLSGAAFLEGLNGQRHPRCYENIWNLIYFLMCYLNLAYVLTKINLKYQNKTSVWLLYTNIIILLH